MKRLCLATILVTGIAGFAASPPPVWAEQSELTRARVIAAMSPYDGNYLDESANKAKGKPQLTARVDKSTLHGMVMCGYQGWFTTPGDGSERGWRHYSRGGRFQPGFCSIDLWPDESELDEDEKYATPFRHKNGEVARVFSSHNRKTVLRHFQWMRQYGIDGVFVQRFAVETVQPRDLRHCNAVLTHCREGANLHGRCYAVMYDLSGLSRGGTRSIIEDWKLLVERMHIGRDRRDRAYLQHRGKPVVALWGIGFNDGRRYSLEECRLLVDFFKNDPNYGGCTVMVGVPTGWRTLDRDSVRDEALHGIIARADIVSPWTVGRYATLREVENHARQCWQADVKWCQEKSLEYLPVVFPGFSWHNLRAGRAPLNQIPRLRGEFLWKQVVEADNSGAKMIYVAMFDEMDEGTAIFKCSNDPPVGGMGGGPMGDSRFVTLEGLPSDHYLWLAGMAGRLLRGDIKAGDKMPMRE